MGFFKELGKIGKKAVGVVGGAATGFLTGGPAGAIAGGLGGLLSPSGGGGGGGGATSIPELDNLRRTLATSAQPLANDVIQQTTATNNAIRGSRAALESSIMQAAQQTGAINDQQAAQIQQISSTTGMAIGDAMDQVLGEDGVIAIFAQLEQQFPEIVEQAAVENERLVQASQELSNTATQIQQQFPELVQQNQALVETLQGVTQQNQQFVDAVAGLQPTAAANINQASGLQNTFSTIGADAQTLGQDAFNAGEDLVAATEADLTTQDAKEQEQLKDLLASQGLLDSGAAVQAFQSLQNEQGRRRSTVTAQVRQQAQAQTFGQRATALGLETGAATGATGAAGTTGNLITGAASVAQTGAGTVAQGAQNLGLESQVIQGSGNLLQAQQQLINSGQAILDSQGRLIDTQTGRELQAADAVARAAQGRGAAATTGANLALTQGGVAEKAAGATADLNRATVAGTAGANQAVAKLGAGIESQILQNTQGTQRDLTQQGLTGTAASVAAGQTAADRADEAQRDTQAGLQRGIQGIIDKGMKTFSSGNAFALSGGVPIRPATTAPPAPQFGKVVDFNNPFG